MVYFVYSKGRFVMDFDKFECDKKIDMFYNRIQAIFEAFEIRSDLARLVGLSTKVLLSMKLQNGNSNWMTTKK